MAPPPSAEGGRYQILHALGRGGMARVYAALDAAHGGRRVALKRLQRQSDPLKQQRNAELFEREFHTLAQLAHPRVVEVYDFGLDAEGPYYTMELLDGGDLQQLAPLPWREACAVARDVCSALSLLHSRRLVHRDISPRNVRRTGDGFAKLIDFGALSPVGPSKIVVGTPPCCAPESVQLRPLDGRTDLYSLGATLYYLLVGQHAYAARQFAALNEVWQQGFARASELVSDIPEALDVLLLDLLRLDPDARPANAAEVMQRLAAIDGSAIGDDRLQVARAYLSTPTLVGREESLARVRRRLTRSAAGRGRSVLIDGPPGVGRSRFLDACLLEANLLGMSVLRADADDAASGSYGVIGAIARRLLDTLPQLALEAARPGLAVLAPLLPELATRAGVEVTESAAARAPDPRLQGALRDWFSAVCRVRPLVIGVDDFQRIDEPSAAVLAVTALDENAPALWLIVATESGAGGGAADAQKLLQDSVTRVPLENLVPADTERLLASLFGEVPHLSALAQRAQALCGGNPRDLLRLSQHLVDGGVVRYDAGAWTLPQHIDAADLPSCIADALRARIATQSALARELACALALCTDETFVFDECCRLCDNPNPGSLRKDIDALVRAEIARFVDGKLGLTHPSWIPLLLAQLSPELERVLNRRLSQVFEQSGSFDFLAAQHGLRAGDTAHALDLLVRHAERADETYVPLSAASAASIHVPVRDWKETYDRALSACDELQRPTRDKYLLYRRVTALSTLHARFETVHMPALLALLRRCSGLDDYAELDPGLPPSQRVKLALERAQARFDALPERDRVVEPARAIHQLVRSLVVVSGIAAVAFDRDYLRAAPDLSPFAPLGRGIETITKLHKGLDLRLIGSIERARALYAEVLTGIQQPDRGGLDPTTVEYTHAGVVNALGLIEAGTGRSGCLAAIAMLEAIPSFEVNALLIRMLFLLYQGDGIGAEHCRRHAELVRLQYGGRPMYGSGHSIWELQAHAISEDLTRMRQTIDEITPAAKSYPGWQPILLYGAAEYHRIRRSPAKALAEIEAGLRLAPAGSHPIWSCLAASRVLVLQDLAQHEQALACAQRDLAEAQALLGEVPVPLQLVLSMAEAQLGHEGAAARADLAIAQLTAAEVTGIRLGFAHEVRARIALQQQDEAAFEYHAELCRAAYCAFKNPALVAKYQRLRQSGQSRTAPRVKPGDAPDSLNSSSSSRIIAALESCRTSPQRAQLALTVLLHKSGASAGFLFTVGPDGPECSARIGDLVLAHDLLPRVQNYLTEQLESADVTRTDSVAESDALEWVTASGQRFRPVLLSHNLEGSLSISGMAVLAVPSDGRFSYPAQLAPAISRVLANSGDSSLLVVID